MDLHLIRGKIGPHLIDHAGGFTLQNLEHVEYFRCCESMRDDSSDGVCYIQKKEFAYRRGDILIGTFTSAEECEKAFSDSGGFLSGEKYADLSGLLRRLMKHHEIKTNPPEELSAVTTRRRRKAEALVRELGAEQPPPGWTGKWLFTEKEAAPLLGGLKPSTLRNWRSSGAGGPKFVRVDGRIFYTFADLNAWGETAVFDPDTGFSPRPTWMKRRP